MLCKVLKVPRSVYYYHQEGKVNSYKESNKELDKKILEKYNNSKGRYGSPKIKKELEKDGIKVSQKRVARRMKILGIKSVIIKKYNPGPAKSKVDDTNKPNLLKQEFKAKHLREKLVSDITYIYTKELGWTYLAIVMDLYSLSVIGYSYGKNMDADLVIKAIENARRKGEFRNEAIFHSDLGSQYTSNKVDNASMESFNAILKKEEVNLHEYETFEEAKLAIFEFIEGWYNRKRIHSSIGYKVPCELESEVA